ncbi:PREDICTED: uncharacterized protein LOC109485640 [Branchiostoma belcheri]|uniref:Uncharacterized protein LOC109485640 n=1 Tax=Branchiostoma belcheri TaxID=7741 RepID=A0A6P5A5T5_BRABE|nr:PREDICTED: uncharacterized protein LOC109485640 [Branchiostoma belcheri]
MPPSPPIISLGSCHGNSGPSVMSSNPSALRAPLPAISPPLPPNSSPSVLSQLSSPISGQSPPLAVKQTVPVSVLAVLSDLELHRISTKLTTTKNAPIPVIMARRDFIMVLISSLSGS